MEDYRQRIPGESLTLERHFHYRFLLQSHSSTLSTNGVLEIKLWSFTDSDALRGPWINPPRINASVWQSHRQPQEAAERIGHSPLPQVEMLLSFLRIARYFQKKNGERYQ